MAKSPSANPEKKPATPAPIAANPKRAPPPPFKPLPSDFFPTPNNKPSAPPIPIKPPTVINALLSRAPMPSAKFFIKAARPAPSAFISDMARSPLANPEKNPAIPNPIAATPIPAPTPLAPGIFDGRAPNNAPVPSKTPNAFKSLSLNAANPSAVFVRSFLTFSPPFGKSLSAFANMVKNTPRPAAAAPMPTPPPASNLPRPPPSSPKPPNNPSFPTLIPPPPRALVVCFATAASFSPYFQSFSFDFQHFSHPSPYFQHFSPYFQIFSYIFLSSFLQYFCFYLFLQWF
jgi:hypothetical protein